MVHLDIGTLWVKLSTGKIERYDDVIAFGENTEDAYPSFVIRNLESNKTPIRDAAEAVTTLPLDRVKSWKWVKK